MIKTIKYQGIEYKVYQKPDHEMNESWGTYSESIAEIWISEIINDPRAKVTLLHEIIHIILSSAGEKKHSERHINMISNGLFAILKENESLLEYLFND